MRPRRQLTVVAAAVAATLATGCGGGSTSGCVTFQEQFDTNSGLHVLENYDEAYLTDPPTSGPHVLIDTPDPVLSAPLPRPAQVAVLEQGLVLVQYNDQVSGADRDTIEATAGDGVVVAPNPGLDDPVVATAWTWKMICGEVSDDTAEAIADFADRRGGAATGHTPETTPPVS